MINMLKTIFQTLSQVDVPFYLEVVPEGTPFPYAVFSMPGSFNLESDRQDFQLYVDVWDNISDNTRIETITNQIDEVLYKLRITNEHHLLIFQRESRLMLPDPDPKIKRRQMRYLVKTYER
jgi:hypothetical protein